MIETFRKGYQPSTQGSSLKGTTQATYDQLVDALGKPTIDVESGDCKTQVEWVCEFEGEIFTIYDWKTYDRNYTEHVLDEFHVGGKTYAGEFISKLEEILQRINRLSYGCKIK
jgi:hypothetical protein